MDPFSYFLLFCCFLLYLLCVTVCFIYIILLFVHIYMCVCVCVCVYSYFYFNYCKWAHLLHDVHIAFLGYIFIITICFKIVMVTVAVHYILKIQ
jgi:hypothetical protein